MSHRLPSLALVAALASTAPPSLAIDTLCNDPIPIDVCSQVEIDAIPVTNIANKLWSSTVTPSGYSDLTIRGAAPFPIVDERAIMGPPPLHEWLSGEFAIAVSYDSMSPVWAELCFRYPEWKSNSPFSLVQPVQSVGDTDADGLDEYNSIIQSTNLEITTHYNMEIVQNGVAMGRRGLGGAAYRLSGPYALKFTYDLKNISKSTLNNVSLYQFAAMHPANAETGIVDIAYDDSMHAAGDFQSFRYDITATAMNSGLTDNFPTGSTFTDHVGFSASVAPNAWGLGTYRGHNPGDPGLPASGGLKPLEGEHCDVENQALANETLLLQEEAAGSMRFDLGSLAPSQTMSVEILFTAHSWAQGVPASRCLRVVDDTGPDPQIAIEPGPCAGAVAAGPYDVIMGSIDSLEVVSPCDPSFDCSQIIDVECVASGHALDRIDVTEDAHRLDPLYYLLRRSMRFTSWGDGLNNSSALPLTRFFFTYQGASGVDACDTVP